MLWRQSVTLPAPQQWDQQVMMDAGYQGTGNDVPPERVQHAHRASRGHPLTVEQKAANRRLSKVRVRVEHTMGQLKVYQILVQVYRHAREGYNDCFQIVAGLTNRRLGFVVPLAC